MKSFIVIIATIILAVYIGTTLINGGTDSLKTGATSIKTNAVTKMGEVTP